MSGVEINSVAFVLRARILESASSPNLSNTVYKHLAIELGLFGISNISYNSIALTLLITDTSLYFIIYYYHEYLLRER